MHPRFFDCVVTKKSNPCFNFFENYLYLNSISNRLGYKKFIVLNSRTDQITLSTSSASFSFPDALKIASYALTFFTLLIVGVIVKAINRYYCHSYKIIKPPTLSSLSKTSSALNSVPKAAPIPKSKDTPRLSNTTNLPANPTTSETINKTFKTASEIIPTLSSNQKQIDVDVAISNYLDFIQRLPSENDIFILHRKYDALSKEFNATYVSSRSKEVQTRISNLKALYQEKIESLCRIKLQSLLHNIDDVVTSVKILTGYDEQNIEFVKKELDYLLECLVLLQEDKDRVIKKYLSNSNSNLLAFPVTSFWKDLKEIESIIENRIAWANFFKDSIPLHQKSIEIIRNSDQNNKNLKYVITERSKNKLEQQLEESLHIFYNNNCDKLNYLLKPLPSNGALFSLLPLDPIREVIKDLSSTIEKVSQTLDKDIQGYQCTERMVKYFEEMNIYFEQEENVLNQRINKRQIYSQIEVENDLALLAEKAETWALTYEKKINNLFNQFSDPSLLWDNLLMQGMATCSKMNAIKQRCDAQKNKLKIEYNQQAPDILPKLYQEIEENGKKLESDIKKIQPEDEVSPTDYRLLKTRAIEIDSKIHHFIRMVNDFNENKLPNELFSDLINQASAWKQQSNSPHHFIFYSSMLESKFQLLKKKPLEIYENFSFSYIKVDMSHLKKKVIGLEIPEVANIDLKKKYKEIYDQCVDLIPKEIVDDNEILNLDKPQKERLSVIDTFNNDLENFETMKPEDFKEAEIYKLQMERRKLLTHIALAFESKKKEIEKIKDPIERKKQFDNYRNDLTLAWVELATSSFHCVDRQTSVPLSIYNAHAAPLHELPEEALTLDNQIARQLLLLRREIFEKALSNMALSWSPTSAQNFGEHRAVTEQMVRKALNDEFGLQYSPILLNSSSPENYAERSQIDAIRQECYRKYTPQAICEHITTVIMDTHKERKNRNLNFDRVYEWFKQQYPNVELSPILTDEGDLKPQAIGILLKDKKNLIETING